MSGPQKGRGNIKMSLHSCTMSTNILHSGEEKSEKGVQAKTVITSLINEASLTTCHKNSKRQ